MKTTVGSKMAKDLEKAGFKTTTVVIKPTKEDGIRHKEVMKFIKTMDKAHKATGKSKERYTYRGIKEVCKHAGDCSVYSGNTFTVEPCKICDCGALRKAVYDNFQDNGLVKAWTEHLEAIERSRK